jgi:hypothetical protein
MTNHRTIRTRSRLSRSGVSPLREVIWQPAIAQEAARRRSYGYRPVNGCLISNRLAAILFLLACLTLTAGCGSGRPKCVAISGVVTYRGAPVPEATVIFIPPKSRPATGLTDTQGRFKLQTFSAGDGGVLGDHVVCVTKTVVDPTAATTSPYSKTKSVLPARYGTPVKSPLKATVTAEGPNEFKFELTD